MNIPFEMVPFRGTFVNFRGCITFYMQSSELPVFSKWIARDESPQQVKGWFCWDHVLVLIRGGAFV